MIYSLEWFDIPKSAHAELITFHPYLTQGDYESLSYISMNHRIENGLSLGFCLLASNRIFLAKGAKLM